MTTFQETRADLDKMLAELRDENIQPSFLKSACQKVISRFEAAQASLLVWKKAIFRGECQLDAASESEFRKTFESLDILSDLLLEEANRLLSAGSMPLDKWVCLRLRNRNTDGKRILSQWTTPTVSNAIGLRTRRLSKENELKLAAILEAQRLNEV